MNFDPFQTVEVPFDKNGHITPLGGIDGTGAAAAIAAMLSNIDDLIVISHGWNNDIDDARRLYTGFFASVSAAWSSAGLTPADLQRTGVLALYWPSKKFDEPDLIAGGAAAIQDATDYGAAITAQIANLKDEYGQFGATEQQLLDTARQEVPLLDSPSAQDAFVAALAALLPRAPNEPDPGLDESARSLTGGNGAAVLQNISMQLGTPATPPTGSGGAAEIGDDDTPAAVTGSAAGFNPIGDIQKAANMLLNLTTYYVMKERAGTIGQIGAAPLVVAAMQNKPTLRVHLVGHSFGGRLVTSLANALPDGQPVCTLSLLQAAYSHYGLSPAPADASRPVGAFRDVVVKGKVRDIIQITHSSHDWAVGAAYPIASYIARDAASAVPTLTIPGTSDSLWGGMGASGAQQTPEAFDDTLLDGTALYPPLPAGKLIRNLTGDAFISGHGDVDGSQVAWAFLQGFKLAHSS
ncbi:MAG: hypothetical protein WB615_06010 [Candidatus Tumulicola sp.]